MWRRSRRNWEAVEPMGASGARPALEGLHLAVRRCDQHEIGDADEQPRSDHAGNRCELTIETRGLADAAGGAIEQQVAVVGARLLAVGRHPDARKEAERRYL